MARPKGGYRLKSGESVPGVTTIIGRFKDSGGLLWWAFEQGKAFERGEIHGLYEKRGYFLHVTAGIGTVGLPVRVGVPSEIAFLRLSATPGTKK